jgi:hypothetical protein
MYTRSLLWAGAGVLMLAAPGIAAEVGRLEGAFPRAGQPSPLQVSTRFVLEGVDLHQGVALPLSGGPANVAVLSRGGAVKRVELVDRLGRRFAPGRDGVGEGQRFMEPELESYDLPAYGYGLRLDGLAAGLYTLRSDDRSGPVAVVVNEEDSAVQLSVQTTPLAARAGEKLTIEARLAAAGVPLVGAHVAARIMEWDGLRAPLALAEVAPGRYQATLEPRGDRGLLRLTFRVDARGGLADGTPFARTALSSAMVAAGAADLDLERLALEPESLRVPVVGTPGDYRVEAVFGAPAGAELLSLAFSREDFRLAGARGEVTLPIPAAAAGAERLTLRLLNRGTLAVEREVELDVAVEGTPRAPRSRAAAATRLPASKAAARERFDEEPPY